MLIPNKQRQKEVLPIYYVSKAQRSNVRETLQYFDNFGQLAIIEYYTLTFAVFTCSCFQNNYSSCECILIRVKSIKHSSSAYKFIIRTGLRDYDIFIFP